MMPPEQLMSNLRRKRPNLNTIKRREALKGKLLKVFALAEERRGRKIKTNNNNK